MLNNIFAILLILLLLLVFFGRKKLEKDPRALRAADLVLFLLVPFFNFLIAETCMGTPVGELSPLFVWLNIALWAVLAYPAQLFLPFRRLGLILITLFSMFYGSMNAYLIRFRNNPVTAVDFKAAGTALKVASSYDFTPTFWMLRGGVITLTVIAIALILKKPVPRKRTAAFRSYALSVLIGIFILAGGFSWVDNGNFMKQYGVSPSRWDITSTFHESGSLLSFCALYQKAKPVMPDTYSAERVREITEGAVKEAAAPAPVDEGAEKPVIIAIMNESFTDFSVMGPLECVKDDLDFLYSMQEDPGTLEYGWLYASTRAGTTARTEGEFLTGGSIGNHFDSVPYMEYDLNGVPSVVSTLKEQGYTTIAMHPESANNWNRKAVYPALGFDSFIDIDGFAGYDKDKLIWKITDRSDYQRVIDEVAQHDEPLFIFNITMQNHGGYGPVGEEDLHLVPVDEPYREFGQFQHFESLMKLSDDALEYLIGYFSDYDRPVMICFFGDHQPGLEPEFDKKLAEAGLTDKERNDDTYKLQARQKYYTVPYFIWTNRPESIRVPSMSKEWDGKDITSANYLGFQLMYYSGLKLSPFQHWLLDLHEKIPAMNYAGYLTYWDRYRWFSFQAKTKAAELVKDYGVLQYDLYFNRNRDASIYSVTDTAP